MSFFKKNICNKCGCQYDELADSCPVCNLDNDSNIEFRQKHKITWLPPANQIGLFLVGCIGFQLIAVVFSIIFNDLLKEQQIKGTSIINACSYALTFLLLLCFVLRHYKSLLKCFKDKRTYITGIIGFITIYLGDYLIAIITNIIAPGAGTGGNQSVAIQIVKTYPAIGIIILGLIGPICEELTYRVGLFSFFSRIKIWLAYIITIIIFALIHIDFTNPEMINELVALPSYIFAAFIFSFLYEKEGFGASLISHILNNMLSVILILVLK